MKESEKPVIFVSHVSEEAVVANAVKDLIDNKFLKAARVFVSSDDESLRLGDEWFDSIKTSIHGCNMLIAICSPLSIHRNWINFEVGAAWAQGVAVIPLCHSGLQPGELPFPLKAFQGAHIDDPESGKRLFSRIAMELQLNQPEFEDEGFKRTIREFESERKTAAWRKDVQFVSDYLHSDLTLLINAAYK